ncbi:MAG TPA: two-component system response regulator [Elusimicrobia bacterium]|nr:two-component system response regulator [Elusimicrobiota bacterium]
MAFKILVVDDSPVLRLMLQEMLESLGHQVIAQADTAAGALQAYKEHKPELVTLDVSLPDGNGLTVLKELRRIDPFAKVIMITGNDQKHLHEEALQLKALAVLRKPFDADDLAAILERIQGKPS